MVLYFVLLIMFSKRNFQILYIDIGLNIIGLSFYLRTVGFNPSCALSQIYKSLLVKGISRHIKNFMNL